MYFFITINVNTVVNFESIPPPCYKYLLKHQMCINPQVKIEPKKKSKNNSSPNF